MMTVSGTRGKRGEDAVAEFLIAAGHTVLDRNWRSGHLELDLVSIDKSGLHFVEVKTRRLSAGENAAPQESVGTVKQRRLVEAAKRYLAKKDGRIGDVEVFFDVAAVIDNGGSLDITYYPDDFLPIG